MKNSTKALGLSAPILIGYVTFLLSGAVMWLFMMYWFLEWWGLLGIIAAILLPPLATLFPFIYWWQESFPVAYILIWFIGVASLFVGIGLTSRLLRGQVKRAYKKQHNSKAQSARKNVIDGEVVNEE